MAKTATKEKTSAKDTPKEAQPASAQPVATAEPEAPKGLRLRIPYVHRAQELYGIDPLTWNVLISAVWPAARTPEAIMLALAYCKGRNLDPMKKMVHIVPVWDKNAPSEEPGGKSGGFVETVWPSIAEIRVTATRTGVYAGKDAMAFGPIKKRVFNGERKRWENRQQITEKYTVDLEFPEWAELTVYKIVHGIRCAFVGPKVVWEEAYATESRWSEAPNEMWADRKQGQLDKCFSPDTEILTDRGFELLPVAKGRVLQVSDNGLEPTDAVPFCQEYFGPMISAGGGALNFSVTPNHDMVIEDGSKIEAGAMFNQATSVEKFRIPISVKNSRHDAPISDRTIHLAAAFACDGYRRKYGTFCISVSRPYKIEMLESLDLHKSRYVRHCAGDVAVLAGREITTRTDKQVFSYDEEEVAPLIDMEKCFDQAAILSLSARQARLLTDMMVAYDGADNGRGTMRFFSSRPNILAAFELAACGAGYAVSQRRERLSEGAKPNFFITISDKVSLPVLRYSASQTERGDKGGIEKFEANSSGQVWCVRVPSGKIVVRRRGLSMICGNCAEAASLRAAFPEELGGEYAAEEMWGKTVDHAPLALAPPLVQGEVRPTAQPNSEFKRAEPAAKAEPEKKDTPKPEQKKDPAPAAADKGGDPRPEPVMEGVVDEDDAEPEGPKAETEAPNEARKKVDDMLHAATPKLDACIKVGQVADLREEIEQEIPPAFTDLLNEWNAACDAKQADIMAKKKG